MSDLKRKILANTSQNVAPNQFDFLMLKESTADLLIEINGKVINMTVGDSWKLDLPTDAFKVSNPTGGDVDCIFVATLGEFSRASVVGAVSVAGSVTVAAVTAPVALAKAATLTSTADVALGAGAQTLIKAAAPTRREIMIKNLAGNTSAVRIGENAAAAARGHELSAGESVTLTTTAAVYAWNPGGAPQSVSVVEVLD